MNCCKSLQPSLLLLAHGQLSPAEQEPIRQHLRECASCSRRLTELSGVSLLLSDALQSAPSPVPLRVVPRTSFFPARENWLLSVCAAAFALLAVLGAWKSAESSVASSPLSSASFFAFNEPEDSTPAPIFLPSRRSVEACPTNPTQSASPAANKP